MIIAGLGYLNRRINSTSKSTGRNGVVCLGHPIIAQALIDSGANIIKMKQSGIILPTMLIRSPMQSQVSDVIQYCDISLNTEISVVQQLSEIKKKFSIKLDIISGGNSASLNQALKNARSTRVNHLRLGEAIFLGCEPLYQEKITGLFSDVVTLTAEVIEPKVKPSLPWGKQAADAFGGKQ